MPTYAYACTSCDHRFEVRQSFSDAALDECPQCTGSVRKLFNSVGIVFKGSGFYKTDSRAAANGSGNGSAPSGSSASTDASSTPASGSTEKAPSSAASSSTGSAA